MSGIPKTITDDELNNIFDHWRQSGCNSTSTAKHLGISKTAILGYRKKYDWDKRAQKIQEKKWKAEDKKTVTKELKNLTVMKKVFRKEVNAYLKSPVITPDPKTLVIIARYIDELEGSMPTNGGDNIVNIYQQFNGNTDDLRRRMENAVVGLPDSKVNNRL